MIHTLIVALLAVGFLIMGYGLYTQSQALSEQRALINTIIKNNVGPSAPSGDPVACVSTSDCPQGYDYECRYDQAFGKKVCLPK